MYACTRYSSLHFPCQHLSAFLLLALLLACPVALHADTRGKIAGTITDARTGEPLVGVNVLLVGTTLGSSTDLDGMFIILNIPPGIYDVRVSMVGYASKVIQEVRVSSGQTTTLKEALTEEVIQGEEVVVIATRPVVDTRQTSAVNILDRKDINVLPVQELNDIVNLQAGVVDGHFRGGRIGEVQYQVDGVSINNPYDNSASIRIDKSIIQEVQVISGTFDAEYGQAMSGVVNAVLRSGASDRFEYGAEVYVGEYTGSTSKFPHIDRIDPTTIQSYQFSLSGPTPLPSTTFLVNVRRYTDEGYLFGQRRFTPFDTSSPGENRFYPTGDNALVPMNYFREWSGQGKLTTKLFSSAQLSYQAVFNTAAYKAYNYGWRFNPDGLKEPRKKSLVHGVDWTHTLSPTMFYTVSVRQNFFDYRDNKYESVYDPRYYTAKGPVSDANYEYGAVIQGVDLGRFLQQTISYIGKASLTWQATKTHLLKAGFEVQEATIRFGPKGVLIATTSSTGVQEIRAFVDDPEHARVIRNKPRWLSAFAQDRMEFSNLLVRAGVRLEIFDANTKIPGDLANPANAITGAPTADPVRTSVKAALAPRLGVSYPLTEASSVFFSYGHFYQYPALGNLFANADYSVLKNLQAGGISYGVMGNPDLRPERTTQYEFGYKGALTSSFGIDLSVYYKDIRDLLGVEFVSTYTAAEYARFTNVDFGGVSGLTFATDYRQGLFSASLDYTYQTALGNSSDPRETATRAAAGDDPRPRVIPLGWDQRHTINCVLGISEPLDYAVTIIARFQSGQPYTPTLTPGFGGEIEANSGSKPSSVVVDLRAEKQLSLSGFPFTLFARVTNLLGAHFSNGFVFSSTGSPDYSIVPATDRNTLADPSRFYTPRRIEIGLSFNGSSN